MTKLMMATITQRASDELPRMGKRRFAKLKAQAISGSADAQVEYACELWRIRRTAEDERIALGWFRRAARAGNPDHQMQLGLILCWDVPGPSSFKKGLMWVKRAASQGYTGAQYFVAAELAIGESIKQNLVESAKWYRRAAKLGHSEAQYNLAMMYLEGEGVKRSWEKFFFWLNLAAQQDDIGALRVLSDGYREGWMGFEQDGEKELYWTKRYNRRREPARDE